MEMELAANFNPKMLISTLRPFVAAPVVLLTLPLFDLGNEPREFGGEMVALPPGESPPGEGNKSLGSGEAAADLGSRNLLGGGSEAQSKVVLNIHAKSEESESKL